MLAPDLHCLLKFPRASHTDNAGQSFFFSGYIFTFKALAIDFVKSSMARSFRLFVSRYVNIGAGRGFFKAIERHAKAVNSNEYNWADKGVWLLKGFIIGAAMTAFMAFVLV